MDGRKPLSALAYVFLTMLPDRAAAKVAEQAEDLAALALATESQADITLREASWCLAIAVGC